MATRRTPPSRIPGLADGNKAFWIGFRRGVRPRPRQTVSQWADANRVIPADTGSPWPGKWRTDRVPYLREIMDCMGPDDPCREVVFQKSHQVAGTEAALNVIGYYIDARPRPILYAAQSLESTKDFAQLKLEPTIKASPALKAKVREVKSRDNDGSTTSKKRYPGGFLRITTGSSSKGLKSLSVAVAIADEVTEWPPDVDGQGDPVALFEKRTTAWEARGYKRLYLSTPHLKGSCRIERRYEASDQRRYYVQCPQCGAWQVLEFGNLRHSDQRPWRAWYLCSSGTGCVIEPHHKAAMLAGGIWIKTYPGDDQPPTWFHSEDLETYRGRPSCGRNPGFHIWQAYSPFTTWDSIAEEKVKADGKPDVLKDFVRQVLGEPWEEKGEAPDDEKLYLLRQHWPRGTVPPDGLVLTGMADVQGSPARLEWSVWAWGIGLRTWPVDVGVIEGDPSGDDVWRHLDEVIGRSWPTASGRSLGLDAFGVDTGYLSHRVYLFCRGRPRVFALNGLGGALRPMMGTPKRVDINWRGQVMKNGCMLWPTGTHPIKSWAYSGLRNLLQGPGPDGTWPGGTVFLPDWIDRDYIGQLTAEYLDTVQKRSGEVVHEWRKVSGRANEALDILVGSRALAYHLGLDTMTPDGWAKVAAERGAPPERVQMDLDDLWRPNEAPITGNNNAGATGIARRLAQLNR